VCRVLDLFHSSVLHHANSSGSCSARYKYTVVAQARHCRQARVGTCLSVAASSLFIPAHSPHYCHSFTGQHAQNHFSSHLSVAILFFVPTHSLLSQLRHGFQHPLPQWLLYPPTPFSEVLPCRLLPLPWMTHQRLLARIAYLLSIVLLLIHGMQLQLVAM
jgi:hypothetical protein